MTRRRFAFWLGFGLFSLANKLRVYGLDELAAATMRAADGSATPHSGKLPLHWRAVDNDAWQWFERETFLNGRWVLSGVTTPVNKDTGEFHTGDAGYLSENDVPAEIRQSVTLLGRDAEAVASLDDGTSIQEPGAPTSERRARHGRPPSKWLRSLRAEELRIWLKTLDVPEAGVEGMTYWTHLTRDHFFDPVNIEGLDESEQAKLHGAAHFGY